MGLDFLQLLKISSSITASESQDANINDSIEVIIQALKSFNMKMVANKWHISGALVAGRHVK